MKLLNLKFDGIYKSLKDINISFRDSKYRRVDPNCIVGLNGTGKSNLIELIAELFALLDKQFLPYIGKTKSNHTFQLDYEIFINNQNKHIRIVAEKKRVPTFFVVENDKHNEIPADEQQQYLPKQIIGYTSGLNETLSVPFNEIQTYYAEAVYTQAYNEKNKHLEEKNITPPRMLMVDYETNILIIIINALFYDRNKWEMFDANLRITNIDSFRLIIQFKHKKAPGDGIIITNEMQTYIDQLKQCATTYRQDEKDLNEKRLVLDFMVTEATRKAFNHYFGSPDKLFMVFYSLMQLNVLIWPKRERDRVKKLLRSQKKLEKLPLVPSTDRAINFDNFKVRIKQPEKIMDYIGVSDGEHQFIHIFGTAMLFDNENVLYLFDEPETHFNPKWRTLFGEILNSVIKKDHQDFIISSHSPYILSDSRSENVFIFERKGDLIRYKSPDFETYGTSFEYLLDQAFNVPPLSSRPFTEIKKLHQETDWKKIEAALPDFGDSIEKFFLVKRIQQLKEEQNKEEQDAI